MANISILAIFLPLLFVVFLWILRYPSKATYLLTFTIPLSPYIALFEASNTARGYIILNLNDLIVSGLLLSLLFNLCLQKKSSIEYPVFKANIAILVVYFCILVISGLIRPINEFIFQFFYLLRYALYFMIGLYVWKYLPIKGIEKYIIILLSGLVINSVYAIYEFTSAVFQGRFLRYGTTPRVSGFFGMMFGTEGFDSDVSDPGNFAMYIMITLVVNILYIFYKRPTRGSIKRKLAIISLSFGLIVLHMTMSRAAIFAFWGVCLYLLTFEGGLYFKRKILLSFSLIFLLGVLIISYFGISFIGFLVERLFTSMSGEFYSIQEGRFSLTADVGSYLFNNISQWWGHGISSSRLYVDELFESGIVRYKSGSLYNGYLAICWDAGLAGIIVWALWLKRHFTLLSKMKKKVRDLDWLTISLKGILVGFLIGLLSNEFFNNFRLMGYFSFLMALLLKSTYQNSFIVVGDYLRYKIRFEIF